MFANIAYYHIFGLPLVAYGGMITFLSFLFTASISIAAKKGIRYIPFKWHPIMAVISLCLAFFHGLLGLLANL